MSIKLAGVALGYIGSRKTGKQAARRGREQRLYNEIAAGQTIAVGQRKALEEIRQGKLLASRLVAVAAAGGAPQDIDHLLADIEGEGIYRASIAMYEAESESERLKFEGLMAEKTGKELQSAAKMKGLATVISGAGSLYKGFGSEKH